MFLFTLFSHCCYFSPRWPLQNMMLFLQQKMSPLFFLSRSSSFSRWASLACCPTFLFFSVSLFLYIPNLWTWQNINLSLILYTTRIQKHFPVSIFVFIDSFVVLASWDASGHIVPFPPFGICLHEVCVRTGGWGGVRYVITKFSCFHRFPIHLSNGAQQHACARKLAVTVEYLTTLFY